LDTRVAGYALERAALDTDDFEIIDWLEGRLQTYYVDNNRDDGLPDGSSFRYRICSFDEQRRVSEVCSPIVIGSSALPPDPPETLEAYSQLPRKILLRWPPSPSPQATQYIIERSPSQSGDFQRVATLDGRFTTTYIDKGLGNLRVFYYRVIAVNRYGGEGPTSEIARGVTKPEPLPPIGLRIAEKRLAYNRIRWEANVESDIAGYRLFRAYEEEEHPELIATLKADQTQAEDIDTAPGSGVTYTLVAVDADALESPSSKPLSLTNLDYTFEAKLSGTQVNLNWNPRTEEGFVGAHIFRGGRLGRMSASELTTEKVLTGSYTDTTAAPGKQYRYYIKLERKDGSTTPPSGIVEVAIPALKGR
jgi:fibronectin type 3 domain-containing protein